MINWIYPRKELAEFVINNMKANLFDRVTIFAPRKRGKTQFIHHDVIPLALEMNILPIYVDFWYDEDSPEACFIKGVREGLNAYAPTIKRMKSNKLSVFEISALWLKMRAENTSTISDFDACVEQLNRIDMPVLLLLDEVQHLGTRETFTKFTRTLRSFMTARADNKIKGIFTGSNQNDLKRLFNDSKAPFYESSSEIPFNTLNEDYVKYQLENYKKATKGDEIDFNDAYAFFIKHHNKPEPLATLLRRMAVFGVNDIQSALDNLGFVFTDELIQEKDLLKRSDSDFALLYLLAIGQTDGLFSSSAIEKIKLLGLVPDESDLTVSELNNAKARLLRDNLIINPSRGEYSLESPEVKTIIMNAFAEKS